MIEHFGTDKKWAVKYDQFVRNVSFAGANEVITFGAAVQAAS